MGAVRGQALTAYLAWLEGRPLAPRSREAYGHQARRYLAWLGDRSPVAGDPLADGDARDSPDRCRTNRGGCTNRTTEVWAGLLRAAQAGRAAPPRPQ